MSMFGSSYNPMTAGPEAVSRVFGQVKPVDLPQVDLPQSGHPIIDAIRAHLAGNQLSPGDQLAQQMDSLRDPGRL